MVNVQGQTFMVIGAAGELPKPPEKPIVFLEGLHPQDHHNFSLSIDQIWTTPSLQRPYVLSACYLLQFTDAQLSSQNPSVCASACLLWLGEYSVLKMNRIASETLVI